MMMESADIVVTGQRAMAMNVPVTVQEEGLGDLKLYRVPVPVTVAANAQKQVALAQKAGVKMQALYRAEVWEDRVRPVHQMLRTRNRKEDGLGLPLPGGPVTVFEPYGDAMLLAGEGGLADRAVGEDVEVLLSPSTQVTVTGEVLDRKDRTRTVRLAVTNARPVAVAFEARIARNPGTRLKARGARLTRKDGRDVWAATVPANGTMTLDYVLTEAD